ncbi:hypothetical protein RCL60_25785, partial [Salmonella enterica subsp. enterica serovar 1,4,[5],12:i:-]
AVSQRKGYENFVYQNGVYDLGTKGDMRRYSAKNFYETTNFMGGMSITNNYGGEPKSFVCLVTAAQRLEDGFAPDKKI